MDESVMVMWIRQVLKTYCETKPDGVLPLLFHDSYRCHMMRSVVNAIQGQRSQNCMRNVLCVGTSWSWFLSGARTGAGVDEEVGVGMELALVLEWGLDLVLLSEFVWGGVQVELCKRVCCVFLSFHLLME
jgi:hypothetical protein